MLHIHLLVYVWTDYTSSRSDTTTAPLACYLHRMAMVPNSGIRTDNISLTIARFLHGKRRNTTTNNPPWPCSRFRLEASNAPFLTPVTSIQRHSTWSRHAVIVLVHCCSPHPHLFFYLYASISPFLHFLYFEIIHRDRGTFYLHNSFPYLP